MLDTLSPDCYNHRRIREFLREADDEKGHLFKAEKVFYIGLSLAVFGFFGGIFAAIFTIPAFFASPLLLFFLGVIFLATCITVLAIDASDQSAGDVLEPKDLKNCCTCAYFRKRGRLTYKKYRLYDEQFDPFARILRKWCGWAEIGRYAMLLAVFFLIYGVGLVFWTNVFVQSLIWGTDQCIVSDRGSDELSCEAENSFALCGIFAFLCCSGMLQIKKEKRITRLVVSVLLRMARVPLEEIKEVEEVGEGGSKKRKRRDLGPLHM